MAVPAPLYRSDAHGTTAGRRPLWMWWHLLSLDAPTIAVLWAHLFSHVMQVRLSRSDDAVLAGAVWLTYSADRVLDGCRATNPARLRPRHRFAHLHRNGLAAAWLVVLLVVAWTSLFAIDRALLEAGLGVLGLVVLYLCAVHLTADRLRPDWIKRALVAIIFSLGSALPAAVQTSHPEKLLLPVAAFAALCFLNCSAIETWEGEDGGRPGRLRIALAIATGAFVVLSGLPFPPASRLAFAACACAALSLNLLDAARDRLSGEAVRVLADAVLLTAAVSFLPG